MRQDSVCIYQLITVTLKLIQTQLGINSHLEAKVSQCSIISINWNGHNEILEGSITRKPLSFFKFAMRRVYLIIQVLLMDNVWFHHIEEIKDFFHKKKRQFCSLPTIFAWIEYIWKLYLCEEQIKLNAIRPIRSFKEQLLEHIQNVKST